MDEALCFGWIDGVRKRIDDTSYQIRFTPRRPTSIWSAVNIAKVAQLQTAGRMTPAGMAAFEQRTQAKSKVHAELLWTNEEYRLKGADTDRGEIFIRWGPPDDMSTLDQYTLVWMYRRVGLHFVFVHPPTLGVAHLQPGHRSFMLEPNRARRPALWENVPLLRRGHRHDGAAGRVLSRKRRLHRRGGVGRHSCWCVARRTAHRHELP